MRVLVVEDERKVAEALLEGLQNEQHDVTVEHTGEGAYFQLTTDTFDLVLLDLGLPGRCGLEILRAVREKGVLCPVLILTARDGIDDRVAGLNAGADDYLVKPFAFAELVARINALARRGRPTVETTVQFVGPITIDRLRRRVTRGHGPGEPLDLTSREFDLLEYLARHQGQVVSRDTLAHAVWQESARSSTLDNVIDVHVARLRRKIDDPDALPLIHTIRGVGFTMRGGTA